MLDGLVRGAVFAQADGVVREHVDHALLHQRGHADGVAAVVAEGQEGAAVGDETAMQRNAVHDGGHAELAHAVVDVAATHAGLVLDHGALRVKAQVGCALGVGEVGAGQVGAATQQLGQCGGEGFQRQLAGLAAGHGLALGVGGDHGVHGHLGKVGWQVAFHAALELGGQLGEGLAVGVKALVPDSLKTFAIGLGIPVGVHVFRNHERLARPAQGFAGECNFFRAQRLAVGLGRVGAVGAALADVRLANDEGGALGLLFGFFDGGVHLVGVVAVDGADHVPAAGHEAQGGVVGKPGSDLAIDADAVVVVQRDQLVELPGAGQRHGFVADAFHQAAIAQEGVGVVVHHGVAFTVELGRQQFFCQCKAHGVGDALAQRAGGGFDAGRVADFRVARRAGAELAEVLELLHGQVVAREVQQRIQQHRTVAIAQHKTVAVKPLGVGRVVLEVAAPQRHGHVGHAHGGAGVTGIGLLNCVHGQRADCVGHLVGLLGVGHGMGGSGWEVQGKPGILPVRPAGGLAGTRARRRVAANALQCWPCKDCISLPICVAAAALPSACWMPPHCPWPVRMPCALRVCRRWTSCFIPSRPQPKARAVSLPRCCWPSRTCACTPGPSKTPSRWMCTCAISVPIIR